MWHVICCNYTLPARHHASTCPPGIYKACRISTSCAFLGTAEQLGMVQNHSQKCQVSLIFTQQWESPWNGTNHPQVEAHVFTEPLFVGSPMPHLSHSHVIDPRPKSFFQPTQLLLASICSRKQRVAEKHLNMPSCQVWWNILCKWRRSIVGQMLQKYYRKK